MLTTAHTRSCTFLPGVNYFTEHYADGDYVVATVTREGLHIATAYVSLEDDTDAMRVSLRPSEHYGEGENASLMIAGVMLTVDEMLAGESA